MKSIDIGISSEHKPVMRRIIFLPIHTPSLLEMLPIAKKLVEDGIYEPVFFIFRHITGAHLDDLRSQGIRVIGPMAGIAGRRNLPSKGAEDSVGKAESLPSHRLKSLLQKALSTTILSFIWYLVAFGRQLWTVNRLLKQERVSAILVIGDRHVGWETAFIRSAGRQSIPSLIVPYAMSDPLPDYRSRVRSPNQGQYQVGSPIERFLARRYPTWVSEGQQGDIFFVPAGIALGAKIWGMMPANPWVLGGGAATQMAVENTRMQQMFQEQGISPRKIIVTGKPSVDQIFETMQNVDVQELRHEWGVVDGQIVLLCAVPQLAEHGFLSWEQHWKEIEFLISTLTAQSAGKVVLSLHPKSNPEDYRPIAERYGAILAARRIYDLLPASDILIAMFSSTVMQAIGLGIPAVVVDFYGQNYTFYDADVGVVVLNQREDLAPLLDRVVSNPLYYDQLAQAQNRSSAEWVLLDGKCTHRVMDLIYKTIDNRAQV